MEQATYGRGLEKLDLLKKLGYLYNKISSLENLHPCKEVDELFSNLVQTCIAPSDIDIGSLKQEIEIEEMRSNLVKICAKAEGLLESHYSTLLGSFDKPLDHLQLFPYHQNYLKLSQIEFSMLKKHFTSTPKKVAFVGSGPLPLTSILLARHHLKTTTFDNFDLNPCANVMASALVSAHGDLASRMFFRTTDIMEVTGSSLREYDVVFLAALVGMYKEEKARVIDHLAKHMSPGALLLVRSAHGARAFLYPVVEPSHLQAFQLLSVFHPTDDVVNSVLVAKLC